MSSEHSPLLELERLCAQFHDRIQNLEERDRIVSTALVELTKRTNYNFDLCFKKTRCLQIVVFGYWLWRLLLWLWLVLFC